MIFLDTYSFQLTRELFKQTDQLIHRQTCPIDSSKRVGISSTKNTRQTIIIIQMACSLVIHDPKAITAHNDDPDKGGIVIELSRDD